MSRPWINYFLQSFLAMVAIFIVLITLSLQHIVIVSSIGASAFIVFTMPGSVTARPRNVIGGHMIGFTCGSLCWYAGLFFPRTELVVTLAMYSLAVGLSILLMVITGTEHPPASGTALATAISGFSFKILLALIISTCVLSAIKYILKPYLKDLV